MIKYIFSIALIGIIYQFGFNIENEGQIDSVQTLDSLGQKIASHDFGATLYMGSHESIDDLLSVIKDKYKGKAVILDLWGTFCKPCLSDFKNSPAKKAQLKEIDVHMVYLCAGKSSNPVEWKKVIERDQLIGDHIYLDRALTDGYMNKFEIKRYPNYILIDKEGNYKTRIISAVNDINIERFQEYL
jgi:thiol-disulfide isomerase/thioredoxin